MKFSSGVLWNKITHSGFVKDSFWVLLGNGIGYALMMLAGIIVARLLGSELYGEYGFVKTTMFQVATFATFALNFSSTKFISEYRAKDETILKSICNSTVRLSLIFSIVCAGVLVLLAGPVAGFLGHPQLSAYIKILGAIVVFRSVATTQYGALAGFGRFRTISNNNILAGSFMLLTSILLTWKFGIDGALGALLLSQIFNCVLNFCSLRKILGKLENQKKVSLNSRIVRFSFPIALQEVSGTVSSFFLVLIIAKLSTMTQLGIYTASLQWYVIIGFIPSLLCNVILSRFSNEVSNRNRKKRVCIVAAVMFGGTLVIAVIIGFLSSFIISFYGNSYAGMRPVFLTLVFAALAQCCTGVFKSDLIATSHVWQLFSIRMGRDVLSIIVSILLISYNSPGSAAFYAALAILISETLYVLTLAVPSLMVNGAKKLPQ